LVEEDDGNRYVLPMYGDHNIYAELATDLSDFKEMRFVND
jgi:hypothetical protein